MSVSEKYQAWLSCPAMTEELINDLRRMDDDAVHESFYRDLAFGTGGLRGILGAGTNRMNLFTVMKATAGLAAFLLETSDSPSCAVSYDSRIHSRDFAILAAAILAEAGVSVWLYPQLQPTPMLSFAVRHLHTSAGIMITASHNPAKYNGYKVYGADGCQITLDDAERIQRCISAQPDLRDSLPDFSLFLDSGLIRYIGDETIESYYHTIQKLSVKPVSVPLHVVYSPLNGTGNVPVREMLRRMGNITVDIVEEQELPDGNFPTCPYPNPEIKEAMGLAIDKTLKSGADFCFATDPDCDRMGAGVRIGDQVRLISGNDMGILMLDYLCRNKDLSASAPSVVIKTIVTTDMASVICEHYGLELRNVLTGFKFIGEQIGLLEAGGQESRFLFGFEESYGYLSGTDVRDKDAVNAALLLCEMAADLKSKGLTMTDRLQQLRESFGFFAQRLLTFEYDGESGAKYMASVMEGLRKPLSSFVDDHIRSGSRIDYLSGDTGLPKSDVIEFKLPGGEKCIIRPSGTEPKLKAYLFSRAESQALAEEKLDHLQILVGKLCG